MGYHRLLTHRGYKTPKWIEYFLTMCGTLALEGGPIFWVATHRIHHQHSDHEGDPHTPREGTYWAHMGWILIGKAMHHDTAMLARYSPTRQGQVPRLDHASTTGCRWSSLGLGLLAIGGWPYVLWGMFFRTEIGLHATWLVNSATHLGGQRRFETRDDSPNNWWVALLTFGEGWHNNHHAHPTSAPHGLAWYEIDLNWTGISPRRWACSWASGARDAVVRRAQDPNESSFERRSGHRQPRGPRLGVHSGPGFHRSQDCSIDCYWHTDNLTSIYTFRALSLIIIVMPCSFRGRRGAIAFFVICGVCLVALAVALNAGWIFITWQRRRRRSSSEYLFCRCIIAGLIVNTIPRAEIHRNEQHDSFVNAVTHELKTPVASIRLYLQIFHSPRRGRGPADASSIASCSRTPTACMSTVDQVLKAGEAGHKRQLTGASPVRFQRRWFENVWTLARTSQHLAA